MGVTTIPSRRVNEWPIEDLKPFKTGGNFHGDVNDFPYPHTGRLSREDARQFLEDRPDYIVWSYNTPIAWHGIRGWVIPDEKYSVTTSGHQNRVRHALRGQEVLTR